MTNQEDKKITVFVPANLKNKYLRMPFESVPLLLMTHIEDDLHCKVIRNCPCDCENKYQYFKLHLEDLDDWIRFHPNWYRIN